MSYVQYGPIVLELVKTNRYSATPVFSADGMDYLYTCHRYDFNCRFNPLATSYVGMPPVQQAGSLPAATFASVRHTLLQPRQKLIISHGSDPLIISPLPLGGLLAAGGPTYETDAAGGPFPKGVYAVNFSGTKTWTCNFVIETYLNECPNDSDPDVLTSNRYEQTSVMDDRFMTTIVTRGQAEFRQDILEFINADVDQFRNRVLPPQPTGFMTERITFTVASERNRVRYEVVHRETWFDMGDTDPRKGGTGAVKIEGQYRVASLRAGEGGAVGGLTSHTVDVRVIGQKPSSYVGLLQLAVQVAMNKLPIGDRTKGFLTNAVVTQDIGTKMLALSVSMQLNPLPAIKGGIQVINAEGLLVDDIFANQAGISTTPPNDGGTRGSATNLLVVAALRAACGVVDNPTGLGRSMDNDEEDRDGSTPPEVTVDFVLDLPDYESQYSTDQQEFPFTEYKLEIMYDTDEGILALPMASGGSESESDGESGDQPTTAFVRVAQPMTYVYVQGTAERIGANVIAPKWASTDTNLVLLKKQITPQAPTPLWDGETYVYRLSFKYKYAMKVSYSDTDSLSMGSIPAYNANFSENMVNPEDFVDGIIDEGDDESDGDGGGGSGGGESGIAT